MAIKVAQPVTGTKLKRRSFDMRTLWRLGFWGGSAAVALSVVALTTQTQIGGERLQLALANARAPGSALTRAEIPPRSTDVAEARQLSQTVQVLTADRDRLAARVATLEHNLDDMTGSINAQIARAAAAKDAAKEIPKADAKEPPTIAKNATPTVLPAHNEPAAQTPAIEAQASVPTPVPLPPVRVASATPAEPAAVPVKPGFGVELGTGASADAVRAQWAAIKANLGPLLVGLEPIVKMRERKSGTPDFRLIAGPLPSASAAAKLCTRLVVVHTSCRAVKFDGEHVTQR